MSELKPGHLCYGLREQRVQDAIGTSYLPKETCLCSMTEAEFIKKHGYESVEEYDASVAEFIADPSDDFNMAQFIADDFGTKHGPIVEVAK